MHEAGGLVFLDRSREDKPSTHVLVIGVGRYQLGADEDAANDVGISLPQLTSPPESARAVADWFIRDFKNELRDLASVSLVLSADETCFYVPPLREGVQNAIAIPQTGLPVPAANYNNVKSNAGEWARRLTTNSENMSVLYFCGHGISKERQVGLLLEDFSCDPIKFLEGSVDLNLLVSTMRNCPAVYQVYFLDCCRTRADDLLANADGSGSRIVSLSPSLKKHNQPIQQCVFMAALDGERAFGSPGTVSLFTKALLDALARVAASGSTGIWRTTTSSILEAVRQLLRLNLSKHDEGRSKVNGGDTFVPFDFNEVTTPETAQVYLTLDDGVEWDSVTLRCENGSELKNFTSDATWLGRRFMALELSPGTWKFSGLQTFPKGTLGPKTYEVNRPAAFLTLHVNRETSRLQGNELSTLLGTRLSGGKRREGRRGKPDHEGTQAEKKATETQDLTLPDNADAWLALRAFAERRLNRPGADFISSRGPRIGFGAVLSPSPSRGVDHLRRWNVAPSHGFVRRWLAVSHSDGKIAFVSAPAGWRQPLRNTPAQIAVAADGDKVIVEIDDSSSASMLESISSDRGSLEHVKAQNVLTDALIVQLLQKQRENPLAATVAAITVIARSVVHQEWDYLLSTLAYDFAWLPDGAVLLGCQLLQKASGDAVNIKVARELLLTGYQRGIPLFSRTIQFLASAFAQLDEQDTEVEKARKTVVGVSTLIDSQQPFTVFTT